MNLGQRLGFGVLCLWSSLGWLAGDLLPVGLNSVAGQGLHLLLIGLGGLALWLARRDGRRGLLMAGLVGLALVGLPLLLLDGARGAISANPGVVVFALVPIGLMTVEGEMRLLPWGLAGVAGVLVLLPMALPETARGAMGVGILVAAGALTVFGLVKMPGVSRGVGLAGTVAAVGLGSGALLVVAGMVEGRIGWRWDAVGAEVVRAVMVDLPEVLLLLWLIRDVSPLRVSARYLVAPLLTVMEGWFVVRGAVGVRMALGVVLLAGGAFGLLRGEGESEEVRLDLQ